MIPTKSFDKPAPEARFVFLPADTSVYDVADWSRDALLLFMSGANGLWGRVDLAKWLLGPYRRATASTSHPTRNVRGRGAGGTVTDGAIEALLIRSRERLLELLTSCAASWEGGAFARDMVEGGLVVGVRDMVGAIAYAPIDRDGMRLVDRVESLLVADFLTRPGDYRDVRVCADCGEVAFRGEDERHLGCWDVPAASGIVAKYETPPARFTRLGLGR